MSNKVIGTVIVTLSVVVAFVVGSLSTAPTVQKLQDSYGSYTACTQENASDVSYIDQVAMCRKLFRIGE